MDKPIGPQILRVTLSPCGGRTPVNAGTPRTPRVVNQDVNRLNSFFPSPRDHMRETNYKNLSKSPVQERSIMGRYRRIFPKDHDNQEQKQQQQQQEQSPRPQRPSWRRTPPKLLELENNGNDNDNDYSNDVNYDKENTAVFFYDKILMDPSQEDSRIVF